MMAQKENFPDQHMKEHEKTYVGFLALLKYSTIVIALILIGMAVFLA